MTNASKEEMKKLIGEMDLPIHPYGFEELRGTIASGNGNPSTDIDLTATEPRKSMVWYTVISQAFRQGKEYGARLARQEMREALGIE